MFLKNSFEGYVQALPGIQRKTLVYGEKSLLAEFHLQKDSLIPRHGHPYEQTGYLVSGWMRMTIGEETFEAMPGSSWCIAADVEHAVEVLADSVVVEVFSPVRPDYLP